MDINKMTSIFTDVNILIGNLLHDVCEKENISYDTIREYILKKHNIDIFNGKTFIDDTQLKEFSDLYSSYLMKGNDQRFEGGKTLRALLYYNKQIKENKNE